MAKGHAKKSAKTKGKPAGPPPSWQARSHKRVGALSATSIATLALLALAMLLGGVAFAEKSQLVAWSSVTLAWLPFAAAAAGLILLPDRRDVRIAAVVVVVLAALLPVLLSPAQLVGDATEYFQMATSFSSHGTPALRVADTARFAVLGDAQQLQSTGGSLVGRAGLAAGYFRSRSGALYSYHFWLSSLAAVPLAAVLGLLGIGSLKAFQVLNALLFVVAFVAVLFWSGLPKLQRQTFAAFWALSPVLWYVGAVSAEVWSASWVVLGIVFFTRKWYAWAVLAVALGAAQNAPLILLALLFGGVGVYHAFVDKRWRDIALIAVAFVPAALPYAFYYATFGVPNLIVSTGGASAKAITLRKVYEIFFDFNQGVLPYAPVLMLLALAATVIAGMRRDWLTLGLIGVSVGMAVLSAMSTNWNAGSIGIIRYAVWQLPILLWVVIRAFGDAGTFGRVALAALVGVQLVVFLVASFSPTFAPSYLNHGYLARAVLDSVPTLYSPTPDVFAKRAGHFDGDWKPYLPIPYTTDAGKIRKVLMSPSEEASVAAVFHVDAATLGRHLSNAGEGLVYLSIPAGTLGQ